MSDAPSINLNGERATAARVTIPYYGTWVADVTLALSAAIPEAVTLTIGNLALVGHVVRMASYAGARSARIVGGFGGWRKTVTRRAYKSASGVPLALVLGDAALEVGERVRVAADGSVGPAYVRAEGPAARLLRLLAPGLWWMDPTGTTQVGPRIGGPVASPFQVISYSGGKGLFTIATEAPLDWLPGRTFTAPTVTSSVTIASVTHHADNAGIGRVEVLAA